VSINVVSFLTNVNHRHRIESMIVGQEVRIKSGQTG